MRLFCNFKVVQCEFLVNERLLYNSKPAFLTAGFLS